MTLTDSHHLIELRFILERRLNCSGFVSQFDKAVLSATQLIEKGCPFSLWIRILYSVHEVEVVFDAVNVGDEVYECNLRVDRAPLMSTTEVDVYLKVVGRVVV